MTSKTALYMDARNAREFRERVAFALAIRTGLPASPVHPARTVIEQFDAPKLGDVTGLPGVAILTRSARTLRFSEALDDADRIARDHPDDDVLPLVVQRRQGRDLGKAYVIATLDTLGELIRRGTP